MIMMFSVSCKLVGPSSFALSVQVGGFAENDDKLMGSERAARSGLRHGPLLMAGPRSESSCGSAKAKHIVQYCT